MLRVIITILTLIATLPLYAAKPILTIEALFKAPSQLAPNSFSAAIYRVTSNANGTKTFYLQNIPGVTQVTGIPGACTNPIVLNKSESCEINLKIVSSDIADTVTTGPVICLGASKPVACSQSSATDNLSISKTSSSLAKNNWIQVLVADNAPPADLATYMNQIISLAPELKQIHFRFPAGSTSYTTYVNLFKLFRTAYGSSLIFGFHPDASSTSYSNWNCPNGDWHCVLSNSIQAMNTINAQVDPQANGSGYSIYSIEQSYIFPTTPQGYRDVKACLDPDAVTPCPAAICGTCQSGVTIASPTVKYGSVLPSYGGCSSQDCEYGQDALDYGYPQYYNMGKRIAPYTDLITNGFFPSYTTTCVSAPYPNPLYVVDEDNGSSPYNPQIPCNNPANAFIYTDPTTGVAPDVSVASAYVSYPMTQLPPITNVPDTNGATVYLLFSGEGQPSYPSLFLGASGWSLANILAFYNGINTNFNTLNSQFPAIFSNGIFSSGIQPDLISYGIWNFESILNNNS